MQKQKNLIKDPGLLVIVFTILLALASSLDYFVRTENGEAYTEFYTSNFSLSQKEESNVVFSNAPVHYSENRSKEYICLVSIVNHEYAVKNYIVEALCEQDTVWRQEVLLSHGVKRDLEIKISCDLDIKVHKLHIYLYREDNRIPYRVLRLWSNPIEETDM